MKAARRNKLSGERKRHSVHVRLSDELYHLVEDHRVRAGLSRSDVMRDALRKYFVTIYPPQDFERKTWDDTAS